MSAQRTVWQRRALQQEQRAPRIRRHGSIKPAARGATRLALGALSVLTLVVFAAPAAAQPALPDGRGYEVVTPQDKNGIEVGPGIASTSGNAANWEAIGGCCGSTSSASTLFQSSRTASGWQTVAKTPTPPGPLVGLFEEQQPLWWSSDLSQTIYTTPASYAAGDKRPAGPGSTNYLDLYEQGPFGAMTWLTQGPFPGAGTNPFSATFDAASPDGGHVAFDTQEQLTSDATGLANLNTPAQFLYERNVAAGTTNLVNVTNTTLAAAATGNVSTTLTTAAVGTTPTTLSAPAGPAVNDTLTAAATGTTTTALTAGATGQLSTSLAANASPGDTTIAVTASTGFAAGQTITIDPGGTPETATVMSIPDGTDITLSAPLAHAHTAGAGVTYGGDTTIAVTDSTGFATGQTITVDPSGAAEQATVASVPDGTHIALTAGLTNSHASGANVVHAGDTQITVNDTSNLLAGETITIDPSGAVETATIQSVDDPTHLTLTAPLLNSHASGVAVTYAGDSLITVASSANFSGGQTITIDSETATIASVPDGTHLMLIATLTNPHAPNAPVVHAAPDKSITVASTAGFAANQTITIDSESATIDTVTDSTHLALSAPLTQNHASGAPVSFGGDTTIKVASTSAFSAGAKVTVGSGASQETATIASVPDSTHITLGSGLVKNHAAGEPVEALVSPDGAILGNGNWLAQGFLAADQFGTTTNAISSDGSKLFFESPPSFAGGSGGAEGVGPPHLYMRDEATNETTQLDANPTSSDQATYEGASQDGSLVFFTSDEGLGGDTNTDNELYAFNTTGSQIGPVPAMSVFPLSGDSNTDGNVVGVTAISNDGSHVYYIAKGVLATGATPGANNFYVVDTVTGATTFIATLGSGVPGDNRDKNALTAEPDISRAAVPTPDGKALVFESTANLTNNQNPSGPTTTLTADTASETNGTAVSIPVASSTGFLVGRSIEIVTPSFINESATITAIPDSTHLLVTDGGIGLFFPHFSGDSLIQRPPFEIYRYATAGNSLTCVSCTPAGVTATGGAGLGASGGGSYGPAGNGVPMSSDGSRIFFNSPDPLAPGAIASPPIPIGLFGGLTFASNVYEWENGKVSLISNGRSTTGSSLGGTTPSGNDVFFTTEDQLVPQDSDGYDDIYDARVGGGFPAPAGPTPPCGSPETCRSSVAPTVFFPIPASTTLIQPNAASPTFAVNSISATQRKQFAQTGKLTLKVRVSEAGKISAVASAKIKGNIETVASASHSFFATSGGSATLTLHLSKTARNTLASKHKLVVDIAVSYSESSEINLATVTLTKAKSAKKGKSVNKRKNAKKTKRKTTTVRHARALPVHRGAVRGA
jgi:hypothetical protein